MTELIPADKWGTVAEFVTAMITGISALLIIWQLRIDHERSRRQLAVDLLRDWTKNQTLWTSSVVDFVGQFNTEQAEALIGRESILFIKSNENRAKIIKCFEVEFPMIEQELEKDYMRSEIHYILSGKYAAHLRFNTVNYINLVESILSAWNSKVARTDMLEDQFRFLRKQGALRKVREAFKDQNGGVESFPSISNFLNATAPRVPNQLPFVDRLRGWR